MCIIRTDRGSTLCHLELGLAALIKSGSGKSWPPVLTSKRLVLVICYNHGLWALHSMWCTNWHIGHLFPLKPRMIFFLKNHTLQCHHQHWLKVSREIMQFFLLLLELHFCQIHYLCLKCWAFYPLLISEQASDKILTASFHGPSNSRNHDQPIELSISPQLPCIQKRLL